MNAAYGPPPMGSFEAPPSAVSTPGPTPTPPPPRPVSQHQMGYHMNGHSMNGMMPPQNNYGGYAPADSGYAPVQPQPQPTPPHPVQQPFYHDGGKPQIYTVS